MWELLNTSLDRLTTHVGKMKRDLEALRKMKRDEKAEKSREENGDGDAEVKEKFESFCGLCPCGYPQYPSKP